MYSYASLVKDLKDVDTKKLTYNAFVGPLYSNRPSNCSDG